jgi:hypothetical protein
MTDVRIEVDCTTGEQKLVQLTAAEIAERDQQVAQAAEQQAIEEAAKAQAEADKEAGKAKLAALGLTDAEIEALVK